MPEPGVVESVPIDTVGPDPANVRLHSPENIDAIKRSLTRWDQQKPIVVTQDGVIHAGSGTWQAACDLGWTHIEVRWSDLEGAEAAAYGVADNQSAILASWDEPGLAALLRSMQGDAELLAATGFGDAEVLKAAEVELKQLPTKAPPRMTWVLIGLPMVRFGEIAEMIDGLAGMEGVVLETTANDG